jgi:hypothetical protein
MPASSHAQQIPWQIIILGVSALLLIGAGAVAGFLGRRQKGTTTERPPWQEGMPFPTPREFDWGK